MPGSNAGHLQAGGRAKWDAKVNEMKKITNKNHEIRCCSM